MEVDRKLKEPSGRLDDRQVRKLAPPATGNRRVPDFGPDRVPGLNAQITAAGLRSWVLRYRFGGAEYLYTFANFPELNTKAARVVARRLRQQIRDGIDPKATRDAVRQAPTVATLAARYVAEHLPEKRPRSAAEDRALLEGYILPALGALKVASVARDHVARLHREITLAGKPVRANRMLALLRTMLGCAVQWEMRPDNPARGGRGGIAMNPEDPRERFLSPAEIARLAEVLERHPERTTAALIRFLMLTGARFGEAASATWQQLDLERGTWTKPSRHTKQKRQHAVPLSAPALALLASLERAGDNPLVFPSGKTGRALVTIKSAWRGIRREAGLPDVRLHDLRHSFASVLASSGASLQLIGSLLGHAQVATTQRYAHLSDDARREAVERVGAVLAGGAGGEVVPIGRGRRG